MRTVEGQQCETCHRLDADGKDQDYDCNCRAVYSAASDRVEKMEQDLILRMHTAFWKEPAVMFESAGHPNMFWYVGFGSWSVDARYGDPGPAGYWIPDPPLDMHFPN